MVCIEFGFVEELNIVLFTPVLDETSPSELIV
jgi:hypothetical protein